MTTALAVLYAVVGISFAVGVAVDCQQDYDKPGLLWLLALAVFWPVFLPFLAVLR